MMLLVVALLGLSAPQARAFSFADFQKLYADFFQVAISWIVSLTQQVFVLQQRVAELETQQYQNLSATNTPETTTTLQESTITTQENTSSVESSSTPLVQATSTPTQSLPQIIYVPTPVYVEVPVAPEPIATTSSEVLSLPTSAPTSTPPSDRQLLYVEQDFTPILTLNANGTSTEIIVISIGEVIAFEWSVEIKAQSIQESFQCNGEIKNSNSEVLTFSEVGEFEYAVNCVGMSSGVGTRKFIKIIVQ